MLCIPAATLRLQVLAMAMRGEEEEREEEAEVATKAAPPSGIRGALCEVDRATRSSLRRNSMFLT